MAYKDKTRIAEYYQKNKEKIKGRAALNYEKHKEKRREYSKKYYKKNKKHKIEQGKIYRQKHREKTRENNRRYRISLREAVFVKLGQVCCICGFSDRRALQIDHVNGHGTAHRKVSGTQGVYADVLKDITGAYQILCANCNWIKRAEQNET